MFSSYRFNPLLWIFLFTLAPLQGMETNFSKEVLVEFFDAVKKCNSAAVEHLVNDHPTIVNAINPEDNMMALDYAVQVSIDESKLRNHAAKARANEERINVAKILLKDKRNVNVQGRNFLHRAIRSAADESNTRFLYNSLEVIKLLCAAGADIDRDYEAEVLTVVQECKDDSIIPAIKDCIKDCLDVRLLNFIRNGNVDEVRQLVQKYSLDINQKIRNIPLHEAVQYNQDKIVRLLVDELGADVNVQDNYRGNTVFHYQLDIKIAQFLISKGGNINARNNDNETPLDVLTRNSDWVKRQHNPEIIENFHALKATFEGRPYIPGNNLQPNPVDQQPNHTNDPTNVITNNVLPWKLIGGGVAVVAIVVAAKKLYNWWQTNTEPQEEENKPEVQDEQQPSAPSHS